MAKKLAGEIRGAQFNGLTKRESEVALLISKDLDNKAIAKELKISVETVKEHIQNSLRKTKFRSRVGIAVWVTLYPTAAA